jgi:hypothetical protein
VVWTDPNKPLESAVLYLREAQKYLGRNRPVIADRLITLALDSLKRMDSSTTLSTAKTPGAESAVASAKMPNGKPCVACGRPGCNPEEIAK